jgi:hypothetical protein
MELPNSIATTRRGNTPFATLRRIANARNEPVVERCELCSLALAPEHRHLLETATPKITCACPHYANTAWLTLSRGVQDRLYAYRTHGIATWEETIEQLLPAMEETEVIP